MILIDAHVHIHSCFNLPAFFDSASLNFDAASKRMGRGGPTSAVLLLTEGSNEAWFRSLHHLAADTPENGRSIGSWSLHCTSESGSLLACRNDTGSSLVLAAGSQITTAEDLEVLAIGTDTPFEDGLPLKDTVDEVRKSGSLPVVPWGPGKWMGERGKVIKRLVDGVQPSDLFLGDNGGRPFFWPRPAIFKVAEAKGIRIMPGSDPLPFPSQYGRAGSFGFSIEGTIHPDHPLRDLMRLLRNPKTRFEPYGRLERPLPFLYHQLQMQRTKRKRKKATLIST